MLESSNKMDLKFKVLNNILSMQFFMALSALNQIRLVVKLNNIYIKSFVMI